MTFFLPFFFEIFFSILIILLICHYFCINNKLLNDNFPIEQLNSFILLSLICLLYFYIQETSFFYYSNNLILIDYNNIIIKFFLLLQLFIFCLIWPNFLSSFNTKETIKILILILFIMIGLCIALNSRDFLLLYLGIELASLPIYILVCNKDYMISIEAGIKYYILGVVCSFLFLLGISFIYGLTGSTNFNNIYIYELYTEFYDNYYFYLVFLLIIIIFLFKIGLYPFNFWVTNFNEGASLNIVYFLAIIPKLPFSYILLLLLFDVFNISLQLKLYIHFLLVILSFITIFISVIEGFTDNHIGRIIGQSSMINMSFIFIVLGYLSFIQESLLLLLFLFYLIPTLCFFILLTLKDVAFKKRDVTVLQDIFVINNYILLLFFFTIISLSGLPFLAGFLGKLFLFNSLINYNLNLLVIFLVISSLFTNLFYIRLFFFVSSRYRFYNVKIKKNKFYKYLLLTIFCFINFLLILLQEPLIGGLFNLFL